MPATTLPVEEFLASLRDMDQEELDKTLLLNETLDADVIPSAISLLDASREWPTQASPEPFSVYAGLVARAAEFALAGYASVHTEGNELVAAILEEEEDKCQLNAMVLGSFWQWVDAMGKKLHQIKAMTLLFPLTQEKHDKLRFDVMIGTLEMFQENCKRAIIEVKDEQGRRQAH